MAKGLIGLWVGPILNFGLRFTTRRVGVALLYHTVDTREGNPEKELVPPIERSRFRWQLQHLKRFYHVVSVDRFLSTIAGRRRGERIPVCLTFDDDLRQHFEHAMPILRAEDVPAAFFLTGAGLDGSRRLGVWWEQLQRAFDLGFTAPDVSRLIPGRAGLGESSRLDIHGIAAAVEDLTPEDRDQLSLRLAELAGPDPTDRDLSTDEIKAVHDAGFMIGFHTRRHHVLPALDDKALRRALEDGRAELAELVDSALDTIAYPHGLADQRVAATAREAGFRLGFTGNWRAATPACDPLLLGRYMPLSDAGITFMSKGRFALSVVQTMFRTDG